MENKLMKCVSCGAELAEGAKFCEKCGQAVEPERETEQKLYSETATEIPLNSTEKVEKKGMSKKVKKVISICVIILVVFLFISFSSRDPIGDTKAVVFDDWTTETIGDLLDEKMSNVTWEKTKDNKNHYTVTATGFVPDLYGNMTILFDVNYAGDSVYTKMVSVSYDGDTYTDTISLAYVMGILTN